MLCARGAAACLAVTLLAAGCSSSGSPADPTPESVEVIEATQGVVEQTDEPASAVLEQTAGDAAVESCDQPPSRAVLRELPDGSAESLIAASQVIFPCSSRVVLVEEDWAVESLGEAVESAIAIGAPVLRYSDGLIDDELMAELNRLQPDRVRVYGSLADGEQEKLSRPVVFPGGMRLIKPARQQLHREQFERIAERNTGPVSTVYVGTTDMTANLLLLPLVRASGAELLVGDIEDPNAVETIANAVARDANLVFPAGFSLTDRWRLDLAIAGTELPGGGTEMFPGRRLVAFYGSPVTFRLGVLGEQDALETLERMAPIVESYATADQRNVIPAFEIIATVADSKPGGDGDYSLALSPDKIAPWIDVATEADAFVIIDLQPGRANFLEQAKRYEEFLRLPNVGLALDPEWRIGPNALPLQRIGSVSADEVNAVSDWLVELVRDEVLPQKPLVIHQFLRSMVPDRENIKTPPELATVIHVDGQGGLGSKFNTYENVTGQEIDPEQDLWWGWKNFYDEDRPVARPDQVNDADPFPVIITFQ